MAELTSRWGHCLSESWGVWHCEDSVSVELVVGRNRLSTSRSLSVCMNRLGSTALGKSFLFSHSLNCIIGQSKFVSQFNSTSIHVMCLPTSKTCGCLLRGDHRQNKGFNKGERQCGLHEEIQDSVACAFYTCHMSISCTKGKNWLLFFNLSQNTSCRNSVSKVLSHKNILPTIRDVLAKPTKIVRQGFC